jgi:hypothetical protein
MNAPAVQQHLQLVQERAMDARKHQHVACL